MSSAAASTRHAGRAPWLLEEHADAKDEAVVALLEEDAFGPLGVGIIDLEGFGQLDE